MAQVKYMNADQFLTKHASIFAYHPPSRMLIWGCYDHEKQHWELHKNGVTVDAGCSPEGDQYDTKLLTHYEILGWLRSKVVHDVEYNTDNYIRGRISPDKSTIYVHDNSSREHSEMINRARETHVANALRKVATYMKEQTTEKQIYGKNAFSYHPESRVV